jgi:hypothetical protein
MSSCTLPAGTELSTTMTQGARTTLATAVKRVSGSSASLYIAAASTMLELLKRSV